MARGSPSPIATDKSTESSLSRLSDVRTSFLLRRDYESHGTGDDEPGLAQRIGFEIAESSAMRDTGQTIRTLSAIRAFGIPFALDDLGTGYGIPRGGPG